MNHKPFGDVCFHIFCRSISSANSKGLRGKASHKMVNLIVNVCVFFAIVGLPWLRLHGFNLMAFM